MNFILIFKDSDYEYLNEEVFSTEKDLKIRVEELKKTDKGFDYITLKGILDNDWVRL